MIDELNLIGRDEELFVKDLSRFEDELKSKISNSSFLVLGAAGSIGQAVTKEIFEREPKKLHAVDISENNLVELVRDLRSSKGYIDGEFQTFALDIGSVEYDAFIRSDGKYDFVLNLSALKHVRSEKDPFTLMRMIEVNIINTLKSIEHSIRHGVKKYFCVSSDKAANPANLMGATKRIMEIELMNKSKEIDVSTARFANVAFSDGSLLHGFNQRILKRQPLVAPSDVKRYFIISKEAAQLCLMSCIFGSNRDVFFPKLNKEFHLIPFSDIALRYLKNLGLEPHLCHTEEEAREYVKTNSLQKKWPCLLTTSDTTGEKKFEEFYTKAEDLDMISYQNIGIIKNEYYEESGAFKKFLDDIEIIKKRSIWSKDEIAKIIKSMLPNLKHEEKGRYLDGKM